MGFIHLISYILTFPFVFEDSPNCFHEFCIQKGKDLAMQNSKEYDMT